MTRIDRRVRQLEARVDNGHNTSRAGGEIWIELKDGTMRGKGGELLSGEQFEQRLLSGRVVLILPDNGRDEPMPTISARRTRSS